MLITSASLTQSALLFMTTRSVSLLGLERKSSLVRSIFQRVYSASNSLCLGSDPRAGTGPSVIDHNEILKSVSLYYLTRSIVSSVYIYFQNPNGFKATYSKAKTDAPMLFSSFRYNVGFWPPALVAQTGNLVQYDSRLIYLLKILYLTNLHRSRFWRSFCRTG